MKIKYILAIFIWAILIIQSQQHRHDKKVDTSTTESTAKSIEDLSSSSSESDEGIGNKNSNAKVNAKIPTAASSINSKSRKHNAGLLPKGMTVTSTTTPAPIVYEPQKLRFMMSAKNLDKLLSKGGTISELNPFVQLFYESEATDLHKLESEAIRRNPNPSWNKAFTFIWVNNTNQTWDLKVKSQNNPDLLLAEVSIAVDDYVKNKEQVTLALSAAGNRHVAKQQGTILHEPNVRTTPALIISKATALKFKIQARNLARRDVFNGKSDPFVKCYWRRGQDGEDTYFGKTSQIDNVVDADWNDVLVFDSYQRGTNQYLVFKIYDSDGFSNDEFLGQAFVKVDSFMSEKKRTIALTNEQGGRKKKDRIEGILNVFLLEDQQ